MATRRVVFIRMGERSLIERILIGIVALTLVVLGFFFLAAALVAGAILAGVILLRLWWIRRKLSKAADDEFITTDYTVVEREPLEHQPLNAENIRNKAPDS
jgi:hypothetical protein